ncbi:hypothetical protein DXG03_007960, partial [Asterophora parasitica]
SDTTMHFPNLNDANYAEWAIRMEAVLVHQDGMEKAVLMITAEVEVLKKKRDVSKMDKACTKLILHVENGQLSHMHSHDPLEIWETLEHLHCAARFTTSLAL